MPTVTPSYTFTGATDPITATKLNLLSAPSVTLGNSEVTTTIIANNSVTTAKLVAAASNNTFLARSTAGAGNFEAVDTTTTGLGFYTGAGGMVTQLTSKATPFTLNTMCGQITTSGSSLAHTTTVSAVWTNSKIAATDVVIINHKSGGTIGSYVFNISCGSGTATLYIQNVETAGALTEVLVLSFVVIKGVTS